MTKADGPNTCWPNEWFHQMGLTAVVLNKRSMFEQHTVLSIRSGQQKFQ